VLAQQVVMTELDLHPGPGRAWWSDAWDGYAADRDRILRFLWERQPANPVVLTGDIHAFFVNDLRLPGGGPDAPVVATELIGTSISSGASKSRLRGYTRCTVIATAGPPICGSSTRSSGRARRSAPWPATWWNPVAPARNGSRMESVDNNIWGCLGSTVTDRSRGSEPEFAGLRTKPRKQKRQA
jgi:hypothetical protein